MMACGGGRGVAVRRGGGLPGRRVVGGAWDCSPMGLLGASALGRGPSLLASLEMTAGDSARALAGGRIRFLLASVLQHAMIIDIDSTAKLAVRITLPFARCLQGSSVAAVAFCTGTLATTRIARRALPHRLLLPSLAAPILST